MTQLEQYNFLEHLTFSHPVNSEFLSLNESPCVVSAFLAVKLNR